MAMKGFMRLRGTSWELRVYLSADPVTGEAALLVEVGEVRQA